MTPRVRSLLLASSAAFSVACAPGPDVVAEQVQARAGKDGGPYLNVPDPDPSHCRPGLYKGTFQSQATTTTPAGFNLQGEFTFVLEKSPQGEFYSLADNSKLQGTAAMGVTFSAKIKGSQACVSGAFQSSIQDGSFEVMSGNTTTVAGAFHGDVYGDFHEPPVVDGMRLHPVFSGQWAVYLTSPGTAGVGDAGPGPFLSGGIWFAYWIAPEG